MDQAQLLLSFLPQNSLSNKAAKSSLADLFWQLFFTVLAGTAHSHDLSLQYCLSTIFTQPDGKPVAMGDSH